MKGYEKIFTVFIFDTSRIFLREEHRSAEVLGYTAVGAGPLAKLRRHLHWHNHLQSKQSPVKFVRIATFKPDSGFGKRGIGLQVPTI
jgi:hypothetical protein